MIQNLILQLIDLLVEILADEIPNTGQHIKANSFELSLSTLLPVIVLVPGDFTISLQPGEGTTTAPRPEEFRQKFVVSETSPLGPYTLTQTPLQGSVQCKVFFDEGKVSERQVELQEKKDFSVNYSTKECSFIYDISQAGSILWIYSFVSIFTLRDFEQELLVDLYVSNAGELEKFTSLIAGSILTHHDALVGAYNQDPSHQTAYNSGHVGTVHLLSQIQFLEGKPEYNPSVKIRLKFIVSGQIKAAREIAEGFGLIEKVRRIGKLIAS